MSKAPVTKPSKTAEKKDSTTTKTSPVSEPTKKVVSPPKPAEKVPATKEAAKKPVAKPAATSEAKEVTPKKENEPAVPEKKEKTPEELKAERLANYRKAGKIAKEVKVFIRPQVITGAKVLDLCEAIEKKIAELSGECGFPANMSINNKAAHYTASPRDELVLKEGDVVKVDFGVHIDGCVVDTAFTVNLSKDPALKDIVAASQEAVVEAVKLIKPGSKTNELGAIIEKTVKKYGFRPIQNLTGHQLEEWIVHGEKVIPCVERPHGEEMLEDEVYAVEVFASTGEGKVSSSQKGEIFQLDISSARVPIRNKFAKKILGIIYKKYKSLPFAKRWIAKEVKAYEFAMRELERAGKLNKYGVLQEGDNVFISQHEQTILITKDGHEILVE